MKNRKETVKDYKGFVESNKSSLDKNLIKEGFLNKMWRSFTGADEKDIEELSDKVKNLYDSFNEVGKKEFKRLLSVFVRKEDLPSWSSSGQMKDFNHVLDGKKWYGDTSDFVKPHLGRSIDKIKKNLKDIYEYLSSEEKKIKEEEDKEKIEKEVAKNNEEIKKYNRILNSNEDILINFKENEIVKKLGSIIKSIGSPWPGDYGVVNPKRDFLDLFSMEKKNSEFIKTPEFEKLENFFKERNKIIEENDLTNFYERIKEKHSSLEPHGKLEIIRFRFPVPGQEAYEKSIEWCKENLKGKTCSEILKSMVDLKIIEIEKSYSKKAKSEKDKMVAGNIVYSGQNFNDLTLEKIDNFINKRGYRENLSGKCMYTTNNIPYAFYYCNLRFHLEGQRVQGNLFPTVYKITLRPGSQFFYQKDTDIDETESGIARFCGVSGYHSGNDIVNNQSVEISIVDSSCIEKIEAIDPKDLISYLESPELKKDNDEWIPEDRYKTEGKEIEWYKELSKNN
jgi:hypothetical protein